MMPEAIFLVTVVVSRTYQQRIAANTGCEAISALTDRLRTSDQVPQGYSISDVSARRISELAANDAERQ
jgi:hypothetical protein